MKAPTVVFHIENSKLLEGTFNTVTHDILFVDAPISPIIPPYPLFSFKSARLYVAITLFIYTFVLALARTVLAAAVVCMIDDGRNRSAVDENSTMTISGWNSSTVVPHTGQDETQCVLSDAQKDAYGVSK